MNIALIYAASPVMIALGAALWLREAFGKRQAIGVALALAGVLHVIVRGHWMALADLQLVRAMAGFWRPPFPGLPSRCCKNTGPAR